MELWVKVVEFLLKLGLLLYIWNLKWLFFFLRIMVSIGCFILMLCRLCMMVFFINICRNSVGDRIWFIGVFRWFISWYLKFLLNCSFFSLMYRFIVCILVLRFVSDLCRRLSVSFIRVEKLERYLLVFLVFFVMNRNWIVLRQLKMKWGFICDWSVLVFSILRCCFMIVWLMCCC